MTDVKLFNVVGVSKLKGEYKVRFANDIMRIKVLAKNGHEDVRLIELKAPVEKYAAVVMLSSMLDFQDADAQTVIADYLAVHDPLAVSEPRESKTPKLTKGTVASREADALAQAREMVARDAENENRTFDPLASDVDSAVVENEDEPF